MAPRGKLGEENRFNVILSDSDYRRFHNIAYSIHHTPSSLSRLLIQDFIKSPFKPKYSDKEALDKNLTVCLSKDQLSSLRALADTYNTSASLLLRHIIRIFSLKWFEMQATYTPASVSYSRN